MGFFTFVFLVSACGMVLAIVFRGIHHEEQRLKIRHGGANSDVQRDLARLEERIRTLEAIVTDPRQQVTRQIDALERESV